MRSGQAGRVIRFLIGVRPTAEPSLRKTSGRLPRRTRDVVRQGPASGEAASGKTRCEFARSEAGLGRRAGKPNRPPASSAREAEGLRPSRAAPSRAEPGRGAMRRHPRSIGFRSSRKGRAPDRKAGMARAEPTPPKPSRPSASNARTPRSRLATRGHGPRGCGLRVDGPRGHGIAVEMRGRARCCATCCARRGWRCCERCRARRHATSGARLPSFRAGRLRFPF